MSLGQAQGPARLRTVHEYTVKTIRDAITDGRLQGGTHLVQADLAAQLGVSITPVREALRDLATEGLVVFDPHRGALVRRLDLEEVRELYELRTKLEPMLVYRVINNVTDSDLARADDLRRKMDETADIADWTEWNRLFHACLSEPDQKSRLSSIIRGLRDSASVFVNLSLRANSERIAQANQEHAKLVELYRLRDAEAVVNLTVQHLRTTLETIEEAHRTGLLH